MCDACDACACALRATRVGRGLDAADGFGDARAHLRHGNVAGHLVHWRGGIRGKSRYTPYENEKYKIEQKNQTPESVEVDACIL